MIVPDLDYIADYWLKFGVHGGHGLLFGAQDHEGEFHKTGWDRELLQQDFLGCGFEIVRCAVVWTPEYIQNSIVLQARKP